MKFSLNNFLDWLFSVLVFLGSGYIAFISDWLVDVDEMYRDLCYCVFGISSLAVIYTSYKFFSGAK